MKLSILKNTSFLLLLSILVGCQGGSEIVSKKEQKRSPNLVFIIADDLGYADVGFNGSTEIPTPNIDRIANEGVKFTNGYVSYPVCGPSRAGIITGRYQDRFGFSLNPLFTPNDAQSGLPTEEETIAEALAKANYKSVALGKWHLGAHPSQRPLQVGFNDFFGFLSGGHRYFPEEWTLADEYEAKSQNDGYKTKLLRNDQRIEEKEYLTDALSREAASYIEKYKDDPFFIYLAYNAPHTPLQATEKYLSRFDHIKDKKRKTYAAMVSAVDDGVGLVLETLAKLNLEEETIICFISDNGGPERTNASNNDPLRGQKGNVFEGGIRVPFAMKWKSVIPAKTVYDHPVISLDIFATIVAQSMTPIKTDNKLDGVNLIPYITGEVQSAPHDYLFWRKFEQQKYALRHGSNKAIDSVGEKMWFDLTTDIGEEINRYDENEMQYKDDWEKYEEWNSQLKDPVFMGLRQNKDYDLTHPNRFKRITTKSN